MKLLSCVQLFETPWTGVHQALLSMEFSGKSTGVDCHFLLQYMYIYMYVYMYVCVCVCVYSMPC